MYDDRDDCDNHIIELLLESKLSLKEMAEDIKVSEKFLIHRIKLLGLDWILQQPRKMSRGQTALTKILQKILPNEKIVNEFHIGERLKIDIYCPSYKLAIEYHGIQHFKHIVHFHETHEDFVRSQERDERKLQLCEEKGITLVVFRYNDNLAEDIVYSRILNAIKNSETNQKEIKTKKVTNSALYQEVKAKRNAYKRELRRKIRNEKKQNDKARAQKNETEYDPDQGDYDEWR